MKDSSLYFAKPNKLHAASMLQSSTEAHFDNISQQFLKLKNEPYIFYKKIFTQKVILNS